MKYNYQKKELRIKVWEILLLVLIAVALFHYYTILNAFIQLAYLAGRLVEVL